MFQELQNELQTIAQLVCAGEQLDPSVSDDLMVRIQAEVPKLTREQVAELHADLQKVMCLIGEQKLKIEGELSKIQKGRKALNGYDHIAGHHTSQRLYRQA